MHSYFGMDIQKIEKDRKALWEQTECLNQGIEKILQLLCLESESDAVEQMRKACKDLQQFSENIKHLIADMEYVEEKTVEMEKKTKGYCRQIKWEGNGANYAKDQPGMYRRNDFRTE